jgi:hypothetical protein
VFIFGQNLGSVTTVDFGPGNPAQFVGLSNSLIVALAPAEHGASRVNVTVSTATQTSAVSGGDVFTYLTLGPKRR